MSSDSETDTTVSTESDSSSTSKGYKKRKSSKKRKHKDEKKRKKEKKTKRHKEKKRAKKESKASPEQTKSTATECTQDSFGPALPPHLQQKPSVIGPILPDEYIKTTENQVDTNATNPTVDESDDDIGYGPLPTGSDMSATQIEREQRALELKIAAIEGRGLNPHASEQKSREEWMLELPEVGLRGGLAALSNMKRTFHTGKEKPDFSDRSAWTKTPQSESGEQTLSKPKPSAETLKSNAEALYERARDAEQEHLAKKHKKKQKREESLVELHQKKLRKEQKKKEKELAASGSKPERRPFSRDVDLKINKIDKNQTKQIVDKAKILNTKFSSGKTKYL